MTEYKKYRKYINIGVQHPDGMAYYRIRQTELSDFTHLEELRSIDSIKKEAFGLFLGNILGRYNIRSNVFTKFDFDIDMKRVNFDTSEYGKTL